MNAGTHQARDSNPFPPAHTSGGSHFMNPFPILMFPLPMKPLPNPFAIRTYNANRTASVQRLTGTAPNPSTIRTLPNITPCGTLHSGGIHKFSQGDTPRRFLLRFSPQKTPPEEVKRCSSSPHGFFMQHSCKGAHLV